MLFSTLFTLVVSHTTALVIPRQLNSTCSPPSVQQAMASCLNFPAIPAILNTPAANTYLDPMESWLSGFCAPATTICSDETLAAVVNDLTNHCFDFIPAVGDGINAILTANTGSPGSVFPFPFSLLDPAPAPRSTEETISLVQKFYPTLRKIMCFRDKGELCLTKTTLKGVESHVGRFSQENLVSTSVFKPGVTDFTTWTDVFCTDCMKASFNTAIRENQDLFVEAKIDEGTVQRMCGGSFVDRGTPSTVAGLD